MTEVESTMKLQRVKLWRGGGLQPRAVLTPNDHGSRETRRVTAGSIRSDRKSVGVTKFVGR